MLFILCMIVSMQVAYGAEMPNVAAQGAVLMDGKSGRILWGKNEKKPMTMASTTKIMTAIIVLEKGNMDDIVKISAKAASAPEVNMNLTTGEEMRLEDLLYAMMLKSYNDAAVALAEHVGGSVEEFCQLMSDKAREIGAVDTIFGSPNGLDSSLPFEKHHSTAYDMALIAKYALEKPEFVEIINTQGVEIPMKGGNGKHYSVANTNRFLNSYEGAMGVKTGYTNKAGQCFVGAAQRDDKILITTVLASGWGTQGKEQKWKDTKALMDYGFENFQYRTVVLEGATVGKTEITHSPMKQLEGVFEDNFTALLSEEDLDYITIKANQTKILEAPVKEGTSLGKAEIWLGDEVLGEVGLIAAEGCERYTLPQMLQRLGEMWTSLQVDNG